MTPEVAVAVEEIQQAFDGHSIDIEKEPQGGAYVTVHGTSIGPRFTPATSWVGFLITFQYPRADVYPHFIDGSVLVAGGGNYPAGITPGQNWRGKPAIQVSRKSNRWNAAIDTAALKLIKVLEWLRKQ
jgi:hypothetical protein